ncbi:MAG: Rpn family recombination-promoting nuclease/putative transposase, partial [Clostridiales bacterium]|nr:Rpn family recombination-promoting nuclease/putative transposase [Clostridiales bacterium]
LIFYFYRINSIIQILIHKNSGEKMPQTIKISKQEDIVSPYTDTSFKHIFTTEQPESKEALIDFLSAFLEKEVIYVKLMPNEPPTENIQDKAIIFDIRCIFNDNERANIEIQVYPSDFEI